MTTQPRTTPPQTTPPQTTPPHAPDPLLVRVSEAVATQMGMFFPADRHRELQRGLRNAAHELGFANLEACLHALQTASLSRAQIETLARHLTIGETYFFRDQRSFEALENRILRPMIADRRGKAQTLRLWSAACSSGEEAYSLAILLREILPCPQEWNITLLATDLNPGALERARHAEYSAWSFRALPLALRDKYFHSSDNKRYALCDSVKAMVRFEYLNLIEDAFPSPLSDTLAMDLILCRNVLMYFQPSAAQEVIHKMYRSLVDGGYLLTSANEGPLISYKPFVALNFPGSIVYRKAENAANFQAAPPAATSRAAKPPLAKSPAVQSKSAATGKPRGLPSTAMPAAAPATRADATPVAATLPAKSFEEQLQLAQGLFDAGEYSATVAALEKSLATANSSQKCEAATLLARCYANENKLDEARRWCETALGFHKLEPRLYYLRGTILQEQGEWDAAAASLRQALYLDHKFLAAHLALGNIMRTLEKIPESQRHFSNALQLLKSLDPDTVLPEIEGMTAGRLVEWVEQLRSG